jgi:hypothetical protein
MGRNPERFPVHGPQTGFYQHSVREHVPKKFCCPPILVLFLHHASSAPGPTATHLTSLHSWFIGTVSQYFQVHWFSFGSARLIMPQLLADFKLGLGFEDSIDGCAVQFTFSFFLLSNFFFQCYRERVREPAS